MEEYEILLNDLKYQEAQLELERGCKLTREDLEEFIKDLMEGDLSDKDFQRKIIDYLVWQVFVTDDITATFYSIKDTNKELELIEFEDVDEDILSSKKVQTQSPLARHEKGYQLGTLFSWWKMGEGSNVRRLRQPRGSPLGFRLYPSPSATKKGYTFVYFFCC